jgi:hypothetical protein
MESVNYELTVIFIVRDRGASTIKTFQLCNLQKGDVFCIWPVFSKHAELDKRSSLLQNLCITNVL